MSYEEERNNPPGSYFGPFSGMWLVVLMAILALVVFVIRGS